MISSGVTLLSTLIVAIVGPLTFTLIARGGVKDFKQAVSELKEAADSAKRQSDTIRDSMGTVRGVSAQVADLGVLIASVQEGLANTQNTLLEARPDAAPDNARLPLQPVQVVISSALHGVAKGKRSTVEAQQAL